jgi:hypothetical protein
MRKNSQFESSIRDFLIASPDEILGILTRNHGFALEHQQKHAWRIQIDLLQTHLPPNLNGNIYFEFKIPRMGKRADVILLANGNVLVLEFKVGSHGIESVAVDQVYDYALDLKNFHQGSHDLPVVPILIPTNLNLNDVPELVWDVDSVAKPICIPPQLLSFALDKIPENIKSKDISSDDWSQSGYHPTPTIVEAALALYQKHDVNEIARSEAGAQNLEQTTTRITELIEFAKTNHKKTICFVTGVPGAGKTLAGLNIATSRAAAHSDEHAVFLSGNGPLVDVLREALARDKSQRDRIPRSQAYREVSTFIQNIHHFRDEAIENKNAPIEKVVIFDEAQRAWNLDMTKKFMRDKRDFQDFEMSEPAFLLSVMERHSDWCFVICLIGGGQEINAGEAGLGEWINVLSSRNSCWDVHISDQVSHGDYFWEDGCLSRLRRLSTPEDRFLHLGVSIRSFRAESLSQFIGLALNNEPENARRVYEKLPIDTQLLSSEISNERSPGCVTEHVAQSDMVLSHRLAPADSAQTEFG